MGTRDIVGSPEAMDGNPRNLSPAPEVPSNSGRIPDPQASSSRQKAGQAPDPRATSTRQASGQAPDLQALRRQQAAGRASGSQASSTQQASGETHDGVPHIHYEPPQRPGPVNPRKKLAPVPGIMPKERKKLLGNRLRVTAQKARRDIFKYDAIDKEHVRLIRLHQGSPGDEQGSPEDDIRIDLLTVPFKDLGHARRFEALSYNWGEGMAARPLHVVPMRSTGPSRNVYEVVESLRHRQMWVKYNLFEALYHLRSAEQDIWLWVDAICIDQTNAAEKEEQVARISNIYVAADNVIIWLGEGDEHHRTTNAIKLLKDLAHVDQQEQIFTDSKRLGHWLDLTFLMRSTWFSRRWVIQELALAKNAVVYCGNDSLHWDDLCDGISIFIQSEDTIRKEFHNSKDFNYDWHQLEDTEALPAKILVEKAGDIFLKNARSGLFVPKKSLETLVSSLFAFHTSDPRDTINGVINISREYVGLSSLEQAQDPSPAEPQPQTRTRLNTTRRTYSTHIAPVQHRAREPPPAPNYSKDVLEVYVTFLRWIFKSTGRIDILCRHWAIPELEREEVGYHQDLVKLPSFIKLTTESPFGNVDDKWCRQNADSLVGLPGMSPYSACERETQADIEVSTREAGG
jgi:hypothetical protein